MATFTAIAQGYQEILKVQSALRSKGIDCGVTVGGLWVSLSPEQIPLATQVCKDAGGRLEAGPTAQVQDVLLKGNPDSVQTCINSTKDARALMEEWMQD